MFEIKENKFYPAGKGESLPTVEFLEPGIYNFQLESRGMFGAIPVFAKQEIRKDLIEVNGEPFNSITNQIMSFLSKEEVYKDLNFIHKLGILLYGPPGTGKTCYVEFVMKLLIEKYNAICIRLDNPDLLSKVSKIARKTDNQLIVFFIEELDTFVKYQGNNIYSLSQESLLFLDGHLSENNVIVFATTNNIRQIPVNIKERPSRFAIVQEIDKVDENIAMEFVKNIVPLKYQSKINVAEIGYKVSEKGIRIDEIKSVILKVLTENLDIDTVLSTHKSMLITEEED